MYHIFIKVYLTVKYHLKLPPDFAWNNLYIEYCILPQRCVISDLATVISAWLLYQQPKPRTIYIKLLCTIYVHLCQFSKSETSWTRIYFESKTEIYIVRAAPETTQKMSFSAAHRQLHVRTYKLPLVDSHALRRRHSQSRCINVCMRGTDNFYEINNVRFI